MSVVFFLKKRLECVTQANTGSPCLGNVFPVLALEFTVKFHRVGKLPVHAYAIVDTASPQVPCECFVIDGNSLGAEEFMDTPDLGIRLDVGIDSYRKGISGSQW